MKFFGGKMRIFKINILALLVTSLFSLSLMAGGTLRLDEVAIGEADPAKATDFADGIIMENVYDALVTEPQGGGPVIGKLAKDWEVSNNGTTITFHLHEGVKFHSGNDLTADDVVYSYERLMGLKLGWSYLFDGWVKGIKKIDGNKVQFDLSEPYAPFMSSLVRFYIVDSATLKANEVDGDMGQAYLSANSAGTGAYSITAHDPNVETRMAKHNKYFLGIAEMAPNEVILKYNLDAPTVRTLIANDEHDISSNWLPTDVKAAIADSGDKLAKVVSAGGWYFKINTTRAPLDDVNCRKALAYALDYDSLVGTFQVTDDIAAGQKARGPIPQGMIGYSENVPLVEYNLDKARDYLSKCKYSGGDLDVTINWIAEVPFEESWALILQQGAMQIGYNATVETLPWAVFSENVTKPETTPNLSIVAVQAQTPDPDGLIYNMYHSAAAGTWQSAEWVQDDKIDAMLNAGRTTIDAQARVGIYEDFQQAIVDMQPDLFISDLVTVYAMRDEIKAPTLENSAEYGFSTMAQNFSFRLMEVPN